MQGLRSFIYGFESEGYYKLTRAIKIFSSISILRGENISGNRPLSYMPPDKFLFTTEIDKNPIFASLTFKKVFPQSRIGEFETKTDGYFLIDISGAYIFQSSEAIHKILFQVDNIFDQEYYNHLSRLKLIIPEKGRSIGIQYRVVF